jgi:uncharacterized protein (TIGR00290 family)
VAAATARGQQLTATALMFSGGKDSVAALIRLQSDPATAPAALVATVSEVDERVALHGTPASVLRRQAAALGLPLTEIALPDRCDNDTYRRRIAEGLEPLRSDGLRQLAFGDLFLDDIRAFREAQARALGLQPLFPLWGADTYALAARLIADGMEAIVCGIDTQVLPESELGSAFDAAFLERLPDGCDPCGENGEFHTLVTSAANMSDSIAVEILGRRISHERFCMLDLRPD